MFMQLAADHSDQSVYVACMDVGEFVIVCTRNKLIPFTPA